MENFQLDYCLLNKKKYFHTKNHRSNFIFLASREPIIFFFRLYVYGTLLAEITRYFVINVTKLGQFVKRNKISSRLSCFISYHNIYIYSNIY
jgi:hypothetical protein